MQPLVPQAPGWTHLTWLCKSQGCRIDPFFCFGNWYQSVTAGRFAYSLAARPSALRHSVECQRKRLCNVVHALFIAAHMLRPQVMVLPRAEAINAFAAGLGRSRRYWRRHEGRSTT